MATGNKFIDDHIHVVRPATASKGTSISPIHVETIGPRYTEGWVIYNGKRYDFAVMHFLEKSVFGINKGCISKLEIGIVGKDKKWDTKVWYDRGWDTKPQTDDVKKVYQMILRRFNSRMPEEYIIPWMKEHKLAKWTDPKTGKKYSTEVGTQKSSSHNTVKKKKGNLPFGL